MSKEYIEWAKQYWRNDLQADPDIPVTHAILGICSEAGELADLKKKQIAYGTQLTRDQLLDELGDLFYYCFLLIDSQNSSFEEVLRRNQVKLDYRHKFGKNKEQEALLQKQVTIIVNPEPGGELKFG